MRPSGRRLRTLLSKPSLRESWHPLLCVSVRCTLALLTVQSHLRLVLLLLTEMVSLLLALVFLCRSLLSSCYLCSCYSSCSG